MVKLTVVHDDFEPGSTVAMVSEGWPRVMSEAQDAARRGHERRVLDDRGRPRAG